MQATPEKDTVNDKRQVFVRAYVTVLAFLAPLKFGSVVGGGEIGLFPMSGWGWLLGPWPTSLFPVLAGLALLGVVLVYPCSSTSKLFWLIPGVWLGLLLACLPGLIRTTEWDYALQFFWYLLGVSSFALAVSWAIPHDRRLGKWLVGAIVIGTLLCCLSGWNQTQFGGLEDTVEFAEKMAREQGRQLPTALRGRMEQKRAFGPFVYPNSFAAHLILTGPLFLLLLWRWSGRFEPVRISRLIFVPLGSALLFGALWFSGSRAALVALGGGCGLGILVLPVFRRWRWPLACICAIAAILVFSAASKGRTLSSLSARGDYYKAALQMFASHPFTGAGLGEFFPNYMRLKPTGAEETRIPHNMFLNMLSQSGIVGGIAVLGCLLLPLFLVLLARRKGGMPDPQLFGCVFVGLVSWGAHSLADFNLQIVGTVTIVAFLPLLSYAGDVGTELEVSTRNKNTLRMVLAAVALVAIAGAWRLPGELQYQRQYEEATDKREINLNRARKQAEKAASLLPFSPYPWSIFGSLAEHNGRPDMAVKAYSEATKRSPHRSAFHYHLACNSLAMGRIAEASSALSKALEWYPTDPENLKLKKILAFPEPGRGRQDKHPNKEKLPLAPSLH